MPSVETLEKLARALEIPLYEIFYDGDQPPSPPLPASKSQAHALWGSSGKDAKTLAEFRRHLARTPERGRNLLLFIATKMAAS